MEQKTYLTPEEKRAASRNGPERLEVEFMRNELGLLQGYRYRTVSELLQTTGLAVQNAAATNS